jgi:hypothetical protein
MRRRQCFAAALAGAISMVAARAEALAAGPAARAPLTIADAIETARFQQDRTGRAIFPSPDGRRYAFFIIRGDVKNDGVWLNVYVGETSEPAAAVPRLLSSHFTRGLPETSPIVNSYSGPSALVNPLANFPVWMGNEELAYLWADDRGHNQIFGLNVRSAKLRQLTHESLDVMAFMVGANGSLAYDVRVAVDYDVRKSEYDGFSVKSVDINMLLAGIVDGTRIHDFYACRRAVAVEVNGEYVAHEVPDSRIKCEASELLYSSGSGLISPDGRRVILNMHVRDYPDSWSVYRGSLGRALQDAKRSPGGDSSQMISEFAVVDMATGSHHKLWEAPAGRDPWSFIAWSPDSTRVLVGPTPLPPDRADSAAAQNGEVLAIVDTSTGRYERVAVNTAFSAPVEKLEWSAEDAFTVFPRGAAPVEFIRRDGQWSEVTSRHVVEGLVKASPLPIAVQQGLNEPPRLVWTDARTGRAHVLLDPNPRLRTDFALGRVAMEHWVDSTGLSWEGRLYYPAHYVAGKRYPLVIQTHGYAGKDEYSIYGQGHPGGGIPLGPGWSVYLAQPLAARDIAVLQVGAPEHPPSGETDLASTRRQAAALADAASHFIAAGLVDENKVGIMGHSATGRAIEAALAFTDFPYAAAIASDNYELSYTQSMYFEWNLIEGQPAPFGQGLESLLDNAPAFNVERIRTPLQLELTTGAEGSTTVVYFWELFSRLRYLKKPVEYYVFPDLAHGSHMVQNPRQLMALQNRALDWWLFWLKSEEDPNPDKAAQYRDWHILREQHIEDLTHPRPPLRTWHSAAVIGLSIAARLAFRAV